MKITVIGESNIDVSVVPESCQSQGGCTPARIGFHHGGVARNIAHNLSLLGHQVRLMTVFGGDAFAERLISDCKSIGIDLSAASVFEREKSPVFLSFSDESGRMQSALSDVALNDRMDLAWLKGRMEAVSQCDLAVADTLLDVDALAHLIDGCRAPLYLDAVSPKRAMRIAAALRQSERKGFTALKCNLGEAQALSGKEDPTEAIKSLIGNGIETVYLTMGEAGALLGSAASVRHFPALPARMVSAIGSGDAFFAGVIHAKANGATEAEAVSFGLKLAKASLETEAPVSGETAFMHLC